MAQAMVQTAPRKKRHMRVSFGVEQLDRQGLTLDVSQTGAFVCTRQLIEPGVKVRLLIESPMGNVSVEGRVVWMCDEQHPPRSPHEPGIGIQWLATDEQYGDFLQMI